MMVTNKASLQPQSALGSSTPLRRGRKRRIKVNAPVFLGLVALLILGLALVYVGQRTHLMTLTYQSEALGRSITEALREREFLQLQMAQAHSLDRVEQVAIGQLGMVRPEAMQYVVMDGTNQADVASPGAGESIRQEQRGLIAIAVDWVAQHWPRMETAEAGGDRR